MPSLLINKQREKKQNLRWFSQLTEKKFDAFELSENTPHEEFITPHDDQYNIIEIDGTRIRDKEDNSPDQIAVQTGWISVGSDSICLPHIDDWDCLNRACY